MNITKERETNNSNVINFRALQYTQIPNLLKISIKYLIKHGLEYDPDWLNSDDPQVDIISSESYIHISIYSQNIFKMKIENSKQYFFYVSVPKLLYGNYFKLNNVFYIPQYYIYDEPIVVKEKSTILQSLFCPITLYFDDQRAICLGHNILLKDFLYILTYNWKSEIKEKLSENFNINYNLEPTQTISFLSNKFNVPQDVMSIKDKIEKLYFDEWTKELLEQFYNIENPDFDLILFIALIRRIEGFNPSFVDLRHKRLTYVELLLRPFFKAVTGACYNLLQKRKVKKLNINLGDITKHFFKDLEGNVLYDTVNGFSSVLAHKASFKNPYGSSRLPDEVSSIHPSHKNVICPNSITNQNPGQTVSLVPNVELDLKFGIFKNLHNRSW